ncbi:hypothetical protein GQ457_04G022040 [Hibiscus cannabinus]
MTWNRLFTIDIDSGEVKCMKTTIKDDSWLCHLRYGHLEFSGLKLLSKAKMVSGLQEINPPNQLCEACIKGNEHKQRFEVGKSWRARRPLEIVHTDIAGPLDIPSLGGNMYYLTFIDDYSRKCWVYALKEKSEALAKFKEFKAMTEKQSGQYIKILRSNRGGEYTIKLFEDFCKEHGYVFASKPLEEADFIKVFVAVCNMILVLGKILGNRIGRTIAIDTQGGARQFDFIRVRVELDLGKPFCRVVSLSQGDDAAPQICRVQYE